MPDLAKLIADVQGPYDLNAPHAVLYGAHTVKDILAALHRAEAMERAAENLFYTVDSYRKGGMRIEGVMAAERELKEALAPAATKETTQ